MRHMGVLAAAVGAFALLAGSAEAAPSWQPAETVTSVKGMSAPQVGTDARGRAAVVYESPTRTTRRIELAVREPGGGFEVLGRVGGGAEQPRIAVSPDGTIGMAALRDGRLHVSVLAPPSRTDGAGATAGFHTAIAQPGLVAHRHVVSIDAAGVVTVAWAAGEPAPTGQWPKPEQGTYAVTATTEGLGAVERLGTGYSCAPSLDGNLRGDVAVAIGCWGMAEDVAFRPAGGSFGAPEAIPDLPISTWVYASPPLPRVTVAGDGEAVAWQAYDRTGGAKGSTPDIVTQYSVRPPGGAFGPPQELDAARGVRSWDLQMESLEGGDTVAVWSAGELALATASRPSGGSFGTARRLATGAGPSVGGLVGAGTGSLLLGWRDDGALPGDRRSRRHGPAWMGTAVLDGSGEVVDRRRWRLGLPSQNLSGPAFAISPTGRAVGVWSQRCIGDFVTIAAVVRDGRAGPSRPPCLDGRAPRLRIPTRRPHLRGQRIRVGVRCGEPCRVAARWGIARRGRPAPIARGRIRARRHGPIAAGRHLRLTLSPARASRARRALRTGTEVVVRLRIAVRDRHGNGRVVRRALRVRG